MVDMQMHATELCEGIRMKQETPHTLDALCSQLSNLSMQCETCIDSALDAMQVCVMFCMCTCVMMSLSMQCETCIDSALDAMLVCVMFGMWM